jgi:predicted nucleotidyltransferase
LSPSIEVDIGRIKEFCKKWKIVEFSIFGSALRGDFRDTSDIDVLISFEPDIPWSLYEWIDMEEELRDIFGREVDMISERGLKNPYRRQEILNDREVIYAA